ncbi:MAG: hypothetical protein QHC67_13860 [Sphingobium sp.]|uniref:hypothetical protein n=1 Tax=Sphingobium sp. TaxID=1912891 RepID=UPI0029BDFEE5|nr:hypothetical protein [Sphingobium sp.]MDX3910885.1 hypothetical protein [Sphingobium sp.]
MTYSASVPPAEAGATSHCTACGQEKPRADFHLNRHGNPYTYCRPCRSAMSKARYAAKIAAMPPEILRARADRLARQKREQEARDNAKAFAKAQRQAAGNVEQDAQLKRFKWRENRKRGLHGNGTRKVLPPEEVAANRERVEYFLLLITDQHPTEQIADEQSWQQALSELNRLWLLSGDRVCTCCGQTVPPEQMHPPTPGNTRRGMCKPCAVADYEADRMANFGHLTEPRRLLQRDGTTITVAELARRHRER